MKIRLVGLSDTQAFAGKVAGLLRFGDVIALYGDLGAGKTTFARALIQGICGADAFVPSPTFTLVQTYNGGEKLGELSHFDFYRLKSPEEVVEIGFDEALLSGVAVMEWPEKIGAFMPRDYLKISFNHVKDGESLRDVVVEAVGESWRSRMADLEMVLNG